MHCGSCERCLCHISLTASEAESDRVCSSFMQWLHTTSSALWYAHMHTIHFALPYPCIVKNTISCILSETLLVSWGSPSAFLALFLSNCSIQGKVVVIVCGCASFVASLIAYFYVGAGVTSSLSNTRFGLFMQMLPEHAKALKHMTPVGTPPSTLGSPGALTSFSTWILGCSCSGALPSTWGALQAFHSSRSLP